MLSQKHLNDLLEYEPETGKLFWRYTRGYILAGTEAGGPVRKITSVTIDGKSYAAHDLIWRMVTGLAKPTRVYHLNGDRTDNRIENLSGSRNGKSETPVTIIRVGNGYSVNGVRYTSRAKAIEAIEDSL